MKWKISGTDKDCGLCTTIVVEAQSSTEAMQRAYSQGVIVVDVEPADDEAKAVGVDSPDWLLVGRVAVAVAGGLCIIAGIWMMLPEAIEVELGLDYESSRTMPGVFWIIAGLLAGILAKK
ncbi:MAG: hypothetical protein ACF8NJ_02420 [Phycisphaerales bacterium JB038]